MKKQWTLCICLAIMLLCLFPVISLGKNTTEIKVVVHEITVDCEDNGIIMVNEKTYQDKQSFFVGSKGSLVITIIPEAGYTIEDVNVEPEGTYVLNNRELIITDVTENMKVDITFKPIKQHELEEPVKQEPNIKYENNENIYEDKKYCFIFWIVLIIIIIMLYILYKKKEKNN